MPPNHACDIQERWIDALGNEVYEWELRELDAAEARADAFCESLSFGTGGIRCLMGIGPNRLNRLTIGRISQGLCNWLREHGKSTRGVAIVYDTRLHSEAFTRRVACVLAANGIKALMCTTPQPTPLLGFVVRRLGCDAGVCITASHNAREWNGFKVYDSHGVQATDDMTHAIQKHIECIDPFRDVKTMPFDEGHCAGLIEYIQSECYAEYLEAVLAERLGIDCSDLRVVYSPLCGTGLAYCTRALMELGAECLLVEGQAQPDGVFRRCPKPNPEDPAAMALGMKMMREEHADIFVATDPDADRVGVACLHNGQAHLLSGDEVGLLLFDLVASRLTSSNAKGLVGVTTIVGSPLSDEIALDNGVELRRTLTGFKYIGEQIGRILRVGKRFLIGFEESDGYLRGTYVRDKDGLVGMVLACELAAYYKKQGMDLVDALEVLYRRYGYELSRQLTIARKLEDGKNASDALMRKLRDCPPEMLGNVCVTKVVDYSEGVPMPVVAGETFEMLPPSNVLEWRLEDGSKIIMRPSGTEPKLKVYVFARGQSERQARELLKTLCAEVEALVGVYSMV